jgi:hypothetical protein
MLFPAHARPSVMLQHAFGGAMAAPNAPVQPYHGPKAGAVPVSTAASKDVVALHVLASRLAGAVASPEPTPCAQPDFRACVYRRISIPERCAAQ